VNVCSNAERDSVGVGVGCVVGVCVGGGVCVGNSVGSAVGSSELLLPDNPAGIEQPASSTTRHTEIGILEFIS
jgi:hypothetical protein